MATLLWPGAFQVSVVVPTPLAETIGFGLALRVIAGDGALGVLAALAELSRPRLAL